MTIGHEFCGVVAVMDSQVRGFSVGDRVSGEGHITCAHYRNCQAGKRHLCRNTVGVGVDRPGAFAEYLSLPPVNVCRLPDNVPDEISAYLDPFGNAVHAASSFDLVGKTFSSPARGQSALWLQRFAATLAHVMSS